MSAERNFTQSKNSLKLADAARENLVEVLLAQFEPGCVDAFPHLGGQRTAHSVCVLARRAQATVDRGRVGRIGNHEVEDILDVDLGVHLGKSVFQAVQRQDGAPVLVL